MLLVKRLVPKRAARSRGTITVLAGVNGAGKSSVAGAMLRRLGADYYNPDEFTRQILARHPGMNPQEANSRAWFHGKTGVEHAISAGRDFVFETTLGATTITALLKQAASGGMQVKIWFVGLDTVEHHLRRVASRVAAGGHDIPSVKIRARWESSRLNLIRLMPHLAELMLWDNSAEADFSKTAPAPILRLHLKAGMIVAPSDLSTTPEWAKPLVAAALKLRRAV